MKKLFFLLFLLSAVMCGHSQVLDSVVSPNFEKVEVEAEFPGGASGWKDYMIKKLKADVPAKNGSPIGVFQVIIRFIVSKEGKISDVVAETNHGYGMEQEVIRIIKNGPEWKPARQNGRNVNAYRRQPVTFVVQQEDVDVQSKPVLGVGAQNIIVINVAKTDDEDVEVSTDNGTIKKTQGAGKYILTPATAGKALVNIYSIKRSKRKKVATASFVTAAP